MALRVENNSVIVEFNEEISVSPLWEFGGFVMKFVRLLTNEEFRIIPGDYVKVIEGMLIDPLRLTFIGPFEKTSTVVSEDLIKAGNACILLIVSPKNALRLITSPSELQISGPFSDAFSWRQVGSLEWGQKFAGLEFYNLRGWDLRRAPNKHIAYIQFWLAGSDVNCGDHTHAEMGCNTFREIHLAICNGSGHGGMVWSKEGEEFNLPLLAGEEHGPFWDWADDLTRVKYPMHRWQAGNSEIGAFDFWAAIELPPPKATYY